MLIMLRAIKEKKIDYCFSLHQASSSEMRAGQSSIAVCFNLSYSKPSKKVSEFKVVVSMPFHRFRSHNNDHVDEALPYRNLSPKIDSTL